MQKASSKCVNELCARVLTTTLVVKLNTNKKLVSKATGTKLCEMCFLEDGQCITAKFADATGCNKKLCAARAKQCATYHVRASAMQRLSQRG